MRKFFMAMLIGFCLMGLFNMNVFAGETGHYVSGVEGVKCGSLPGPGYYYKMYNAFYTADQLNDENGDEVENPDFDLSVFVNVHRFIWINDLKNHEADFALTLTIPFQKTAIERNLDIPGGSINVYDEDKFAMGDPLVEGILAWHGKRYDSGLGVGVYVPMGEYDTDDDRGKDEDPVSPGKDMWTCMLSFAGTYFFDDEKTWSVSALGRYEVHTKKKDRKVQPGNDFHFEWGIGKTLMRIFDVGLAGYFHWQVTDDTGREVREDSSWDGGDHDQVYAIGPDVSVFIPPIKALISLKSVVELEAKDRPEGNITTLVFTKIF